ncbi:hypothetical protein MTR67_034656 [Solanum verrucosum]|uniref:Reverse transcriptase RNase H-like domain-containing protein n=1 Tax=Solanum verrucosum TaxID=315347 RepID=A0AAF0U8U4_SOLVR|nr:hypothetical protein MTR67_034656 [Solanum verrucosum]
MRDRLNSTPILMLPEGLHGFVVYCDASRIGLDYVLMQREKVTAYASRQLKVQENNYPTHHLELATITLALNIWRHYLYGFYVDMFINHKQLKYVFTQKDLNLHRRRCLEILKDYHMNVLNHTGKMHVVVDTLNQLTMGSYSHVEDFKKELARDVHILVGLGVRLVD